MLFRSKQLAIDNPKGLKELIVRKDFLTISNIEIGGGKLSAKKNEDLDNITNSLSKRKSIYNILQQIGRASCRERV